MAAIRDLSAVVARVAHGGTVVVTLTDFNRLIFAYCWAEHLKQAGLHGALVGIMDLPQSSYHFAEASRRLQVHDAVAYSSAVAAAPSRPAACLLLNTVDRLA